MPVAGPLSSAQMVQAYGGGRLRRLAPEELLNVFGFPSRMAHAAPLPPASAPTVDGGPFSFPPRLATKQQFQLVGNSVSVVVVRAVLVALLFGGEGADFVE